jgi:hypothetical protein
MTGRVTQLIQQADPELSFRQALILAGMHMDRPRQQEFLWLTYAASGQECPQAALANPMRHLFLMLLSASGLWYEAVVANAGKDQ